MTSTKAGLSRKQFNAEVTTLARNTSPAAHKALLDGWADLDRTVTPRTALKRLGVVVAKAEPTAKASTRKAPAKKALPKKAAQKAPVAKPTRVLTKARAAKIRARWGKYAGLSREAHDRGRAQGLPHALGRAAEVVRRQARRLTDRLIDRLL